MSIRGKGCAPQPKVGPNSFSVAPKNGGDVQTLDELNPMHSVTQTTMSKTFTKKKLTSVFKKLTLVFKFDYRRIVRPRMSLIK